MLLALTAGACAPAKATAPVAQRPAAPTPRTEAAAAWDPDHRQLVMFGGGTGSATTYAAIGDTWTWSAATGWTDHGTLDPGPLRRSGAGMAWDPDTHRAVLVGGNANTYSFTDTWLWDGTRWSKGAELPLSQTDVGDGGASMAWDPLRRQLVVVVGGNTVTGDGRTWTVQGSVMQPDSPSNDGQQMVFDPSRGTMALLDANSRFDSNPATLWEWNGAHWRQRPVPAPPPTPHRNVETDRRSILLESLQPKGILDVIDAPAGGRTTSWIMSGRSGWSASIATGLPASICVAGLDEQDNRIIAVGGPDATHDTAVVVWGSSAGWVTPPR